VSAIGNVIKTIVSPIGAALGLFGKPKAPKAPLPLPTATPRANSVAMDALANRRGAAANMRTGSTGAESSAGKKSLLGQ
jgi:hypothetical protein